MTVELSEVAKLPAMDTSEMWYQWGTENTDTGDTLLSALQSVVFYNCLGEELEVAKEYLLTQQKKIRDEGGMSVSTMRPDILCPSSEEGKRKYNLEQFEIFWMLLVLMFGGYGTSPRYGWIDYSRIDDAVLFIDWLKDMDEEQTQWEEKTNEL